MDTHRQYSKPWSSTGSQPPTSSTARPQAFCYLPPYHLAEASRRRWHHIDPPRCAVATLGRARATVSVTASRGWRTCRPCFCAVLCSVLCCVVLCCAVKALCADWGAGYAHSVQVCALLHLSPRQSRPIRDTALINNHTCTLYVIFLKRRLIKHK